MDGSTDEGYLMYEHKVIQQPIHIVYNMRGSVCGGGGWNVRFGVGCFGGCCIYVLDAYIYRQTQSRHYSYTDTLAARRVLVAGSNGNGVGMVVKRRHIQVNCNYLTHPKCTYFSSQPIIISSCFSNNNNREILRFMYVRMSVPPHIHQTQP